MILESFLRTAVKYRLHVMHMTSIQQLDSQRFSVQDYGEGQPVASNASTSGKAQNRRVEIQIVPLT